MYNAPWTNNGRHTVKDANGELIISVENDALDLVTAAPQLLAQLAHTLEWLDNLEQTIGTEALVDHMPNGRPGRRDMWLLVNRLRQTDPAAH